jgi:hypothetical protein
MRNITTSAAVLGTALLLGLAGASPSFAKSHDQGLANPKGDHVRGEPQTGGAMVGGPGGISAGVNDGQRGAQASSERSGLSREGGVSETMGGGNNR